MRDSKTPHWITHTHLVRLTQGVVEIILPRHQIRMATSISIKKPPITNQKEVENSHRKTRHKDPDRTEKAWWRPLANEVQIIPRNGVKNRPPIEGFSGGSMNFQSRGHQGMQHTAKLGRKRDNFPKRCLFQRFRLISSKSWEGCVICKITW
jgi:hypothetical protein